MKHVTMYTTPTCPFCIRAKQFFSDNKIPVESYDVSIDRQKADEMIRKSGQMGVPVIDIEGQIIVGFDKERIKKALEIN